MAKTCGIGAAMMAKTAISPQAFAVGSELVR